MVNIIQTNHPAVSEQREHCFHLKKFNSKPSKAALISQLTEGQSIRHLCNICKSCDGQKQENTHCPADQSCGSKSRLNIERNEVMPFPDTVKEQNLYSQVPV